ncbi:response regulator receiver domain [Endozoicomonas numazuensis]|uniref:Response receiver domain-containing protein n=1 Tax=Endozoicomonas numazuensis TaxID=1137799 RepID=A0A081NMD5_9GAMM|nr:response regulator receiver domain [Endozoicomonas numazuensis]KEQ19608.1 hypothetical protein GZ78_06835 [Endozoicomonas numazuensis]
MEALKEFYKSRTEQFLKTVVCFDDQAYEDSLLGPNMVASLPGSGFDDSEDSFSDISEVEDTAELTDIQSHSLNAQELTGSFAAKGIQCSVIKTSDEPLDAKRQIVTMSMAADIMLLDWQLENLSDEYKTTLIGDAIVEILRNDQEGGGRLRLIVIFSGEKEEGVLSTLTQKLSDLHFSRTPGSYELKHGSTKIVFIGKPEGVSCSEVKLTSYDQLPEIVIGHFTNLIEGILPITAVSAISTLREKTHHLLAKFGSDLDGSVVAHKCLIPDPNDAETYITNLISDEISVLLSNPTVSEALSPNRVGQWLDDKFSSESERQHKLWSKAATSQYHSDKTVLINQNSDPVIKVKQARRTVLETLCDVENHAEMSMLTKIQCSNSSKILQSIPKLSLGTIIATNDNRYLLCIQPLCDSVRISPTEGRAFPFIPLRQVGFNMNNIPDFCLPDQAEKVWCKVGKNPMDILMYPFKGSSHGTVEGKESKPTGESSRANYFFESEIEEGKTLFFRWVANLKLPFAQRVSSKIAERLHTPGVDDYELLR